MQFITTGNRIAVENFVLGDLYTITFTNGTYINSACIGIGENFVSFQRNEPELLFSLTMATAELVSSIDLYAGGTGTNNYDDLNNRPQINSHTLTGNMSGADLGLQNTIPDLDTIRSGAAAGETAVQPAALSDYQPLISDLDTIRAGATAGATAVQPADMTTALAAKQDTLTTEQLAAVNSGITSTDVEQIETNKNNILYNCINGGANLCPINSGTTTGAAFVFDWTNTGIIPAGVYEFSFETSTTTGAVACETQDSNGTRTGYRIITLPAKTGDITISDGTAKIRVFANAAMTLSKIRLVLSSFKDTPYQPYAMSNSELTAAIQALQAQLNQ